MKRPYKILLVSLSILFLSYLVTLFVLNYQTRQKSTNIFDEMYYDETSFATRVFHLGGTHFNYVKDVKAYYRGRGDEGAIPIEAANSDYRYDKSSLEKDRQYLDIDFYYPPDTLYDDGIVRFSTNWVLDGHHEIGVDYYYNVTTKVLSKSYYIYVSQRDEILYTGEQSSEIGSILKKEGISEVKIYHYGDKNLHKILKDWSSVYHSRFSPNIEHWGKVEVREVRTTSNDDLEELTSK
ncbi:TipC family immunity protein [Streptococcus dentapri]|uniref:TipC family immunity protein n=1 Tax=Streptococcus dentapri TaxID=573564 RepID=A0ABV8D336_9STRE